MQQHGCPSNALCYKDYVLCNSIFYDKSKTIETKNRSVVSRDEDCQGQSDPRGVAQRSVCVDRTVLYHDNGTRYKALRICQNPLISTIQREIYCM